MRFRAPAGLDRRSLGTHLGGVGVTETAPGEYVVVRRTRAPHRRRPHGVAGRPRPARSPTCAPAASASRTSTCTSRAASPPDDDFPARWSPATNLAGEIAGAGRRGGHVKPLRAGAARAGAHLSERRVPAADPRHPGGGARVLLARRRAAHRRRRRRLPRTGHARAGGAGHGVHQPRHRHRVRPLVRRPQVARGHPARASPPRGGQGRHGPGGDRGAGRRARRHRPRPRLAPRRRARATRRGDGAGGGRLRRVGARPGRAARGR